MTLYGIYLWSFVFLLQSKTLEVEEICDPVEWARLLSAFHTPHPAYPHSHVTSASVSYSLPTPWRYNCTPRPYQNTYPSLYSARFGFLNNVMSPPEKTQLHKFLVNTNFLFCIAKERFALTLGPNDSLAMFLNQQLAMFTFLEFSSHHQVGIGPSLWPHFISKETRVIY